MEPALRVKLRISSRALRVPRAPAARHRPGHSWGLSPRLSSHSCRAPGTTRGIKPCDFLAWLRAEPPGPPPACLQLAACRRHQHQQAAWPAARAAPLPGSAPPAPSHSWNRALGTPGSFSSRQLRALSRKASAWCAQGLMLCRATWSRLREGGFQFCWHQGAPEYFRGLGAP